MDNENYTYELEQCLTHLLDFFDPNRYGASDSYTLENEEGELFEISEEMARVVDHANEVLYGDVIDD